MYIQDYEESEYKCDIAAGLCKNGEVLVSSSVWREAADWKNIIDIHHVFSYHVFSGVASMGIGNAGFLIGLREDGKVMVAKNTYRENPHLFKTILNDIQGWQNILSLAGGDGYVAGLRQDGTVAFASPSMTLNGEEVKNWRDVVAIAGDDSHLVGLQRDGRVVAVGNDEAIKKGACDVKGWNNIVAIVVNRGRTAGVKRDGTVIYTGYNMKHIKSGLFKLKEEWIYEALPQKTTPVSIFA